ncbi:MAG: histidine phosphatase family protein [Rhodobacteraceae bacterium]|nr:histidine phosphatase family protein [Paracoccaceae bacterium]
MDLYLIRHAPTHRKSMVGWSDVDADFSDTDRFDALNAFLPQPANLVSSDLRRTVGTADRLATGRQRLEHCPKLREINFGDWELKTFAEIQETHAEDIRAFYETPGTLTAPNGECSHRIDNLSLTHIRITDGAWDAVSINDTGPLTNS